MSTFTIPNYSRDELGEIRQLGLGDKIGELLATFNIDLTSSPGKIKVSRKLTQVLDTDDLNDADVVGLLVHDGLYYLVTTDEVFTCSVNDDPRIPGNWNELATMDSEDLGFETDIASFIGKVLISTGTDVMTWDGSTKDDDWWTATISGAALTSGKPHMLHPHRGGQETLFVSDGNKVRYYNAEAGHSTVTLDPLMTACCFASGVSAIWAGTYTEVGDRAYVYEINIGEQINGTPVARQAYPVDGRAVLSIGVIDNIPYIVTEKGVIQAFNGAGFITVAHFPFALSKRALDGVQAGLVQDTSISRPVHPKGMKASGRSLLIHFNSKDADGDPVDEHTPSGIWEYHVDTRVLNHRQALTTAATQYGYQTQLRSGPLLVIDSRYSAILVGGEAGENGIGLFAESDDLNQGYIITTEIESQTVKDAFNKAVIKARTLGEDEHIVLKYHVDKDPHFPQYNDIVWLNATQFVCTEETIDNAEAGDEIEITEGYRAGHLAHITAIEGGTTRIVTIDESIGVLNQESRIRIQNWSKIDNEYTDEDGEVKSIGIGEAKPWIQYKLPLTGDIELRQFISDGKAKNQL